MATIIINCPHCGVLHAQIEIEYQADPTIRPRLYGYDEAKMAQLILKDHLAEEHGKTLKQAKS